jgi:hypothetical protein
MRTKRSGFRSPNLCSLGGVLVLMAFAQEGEASETPDPGWLVDANLGAARVESDAYRLAADGALGYATGTWGLGARGNTLAYDEVTSVARIETTKLDGDAEGWLVFGDSTWSARPQVRLTAGGASYDSTYTPVGAGAGPWNDQTSWIWRGTALAGVDWRAGESFSLSALVGGGMQVEWYDYETVGAGQASLTDDENTTFRGVARLDLRWMALPDILSLRLRGDASFFKLTRDRFSVTAGSTTTVADEMLVLSQTEVRTRAFVDIDAAEVLGFRPTLHAGADYYRLSGSEGDTSSFVPLAGVGVLRPWE